MYFERLESEYTVLDTPQGLRYLKSQATLRIDVGTSFEFLCSCTQQLLRASLYMRCHSPFPSSSSLP